MNFLERKIRKMLKNSELLLSPLAYISEGLRRAEALKQQKKFRNEFKIDQGFTFMGEGHRIYGDGEIIMKGDSYIQTNSRISCTEGNRVEIGSGCQLSHNLTIYTENRIADQDFSKPDRENESGDVIIGDDVWIGHSVFITNNTKIGDDSVIGAKSVVTRDIPPPFNRSRISGEGCKI